MAKAMQMDRKDFKRDQLVARWIRTLAPTKVGHWQKDEESDPKDTSYSTGTASTAASGSAVRAVQMFESVPTF